MHNKCKKTNILHLVPQYDVIIRCAEETTSEVVQFQHRINQHVQAAVFIIPHVQVEYML
jgi:hypothetical protein